MSAYIPHNDDVEMAYIHGASLDYPVAARADALRAEFNRWLAKHDRDVKAEAWEEGWKHDSDYMNTWGQFCPHIECNPYRK